MNGDNLIERLRTLIEPYVQNSDELKNIGPKTTFIDDLNINSAHLVDVVLDIEDEFDIEIDNESMESMVDVEAAMKIIQSKLKA